MRMRKKQWAEPFLAEHQDYVIPNPEVWAGKWKETLQGTNVLHVEIGCGKGDYFIQMAKKLPDHGFVAIEKVQSVGAVAAKKAVGEDIPNTRMIIDDAAKIETWFGPGEIDVIHLNFSDPWPKAGHTKRRLSHAGFLQQYERILSEKGEIHMKTDNQTLFEFSLVEFSQQGWVLLDASVDFRRKEQEDAMSEYETKFVNLGQPIYRLVVRKIRNQTLGLE